MARNEYGVLLDSNGYAPSVLQDDDGRCYYCGLPSEDLVRHEVFHGPNRDKSKALGTWVHMCPSCHDRLHRIDASMDWLVKRWGQMEAMKHYKWTIDSFRMMFGRNYLEETDK